MRATYDLNLNGSASLVVAWRTDRRAHGRLVKVGGDLVKTLQSYAKDQFAVIAQAEPRPYDPDDIQEEDDCTVLSTNLDEIFDTPLLEELRTGSSLRLIGPSELRERKIVCYALLIGNRSDDRIIFIKKTNPIKLTKKGAISTFLGDQTLTKLSEPLLAFDENFDVVIYRESVWILRQKQFELLFKDSSAVLAKTGQWVNELDKVLPMTDESKERLTIRLTQTSVMRRKLLSILRSPYLQKLTPEILRDKMNEAGLDPSKLLEGDKLVFTKETEKDILLLLNEDLWTGGFSGERYSATRKARRQIGTSDAV